MKTRKGLMFRENVKSEIVRLITTIREILLELGRKFTTEQILEKCDDIFFLRLDELAAVAEKRVDFDIHQTIKNRRLEYEKYKSLTPPEIVIGRFDSDTYVPEEIDTQVTLLKGTSACPGIVKGPARVILRADENQHVQPGEILVAPFTDPGWTPYFLNAAGIVMDQGGLLAHGSIIAREYGIPAVVNVGPATKIIKTGQMIQVDANRGVVKILR
jgi:pyruvate,water dikinase